MQRCYLSFRFRAFYLTPQTIRLNNHYFFVPLGCIFVRYCEYRGWIRFTCFQKLANRILLWFSEIPKFAAKDKGSQQTSRLREQCGSIKGDLKLNIVLAHRHAMFRMGSIRKFQALSAKKPRVVQSGCAREKSTENRFYKRDVTSREKRVLDLPNFFRSDLLGCIMPYYIAVTQSVYNFSDKIKHFIFRQSIFKE